jgi:hypothetical protein
MPDSLSLSDLAMLDALGEATPEQRAALRAACERDPELAAEHRRLLGEVRLMDAALAPAPAASEPAPPMPGRIHRQLDAERRALIAEHSERHVEADRRASVVVPNRLPAADEPAPIVQRRRGGRLAWVATVVILGTLAAIYFRPHPPAAPVAGRSPRLLAPTGETSRTEPLIVWENAPDPSQLYDVWVLPPEGPFEKVAAIYESKGVRSPVAFDRLAPTTSASETTRGLQPGKNYRLLVCISKAGRIAGTAVPFSTSPTANSAAPTASDTTDSIQQARHLLESSHPGDAMMVLAALPETERELPEVRALMEQIKARIGSSNR